jgi:hypothetical protein
MEDKMDSLKCGRNIIELQKGDIVMDNGACRQLIASRLRAPLLVSKKEFERFKKMNVSKKVDDGKWGFVITYYEYLGES